MLRGLLIVRGLHRAAIVDALGISASTLEKHLCIIYAAVHEHSIAGVQAWALTKLRGR